MDGQARAEGGREVGRDDISAESVWANPLAAPCLLSPPSHTSPLLLRQQHHPSCARHCLGLVVKLCGVCVCVNMEH